MLYRSTGCFTSSPADSLYAYLRAVMMRGSEDKKGELNHEVLRRDIEVVEYMNDLLDSF